MIVEQNHLKSEQAQQLEFLLTVLQSINDSSANPDVVYPLLQQNLALLNDGMIEVLKDWVTAKFAEVDRDSQKSIASTISDLGYLILQFLLKDKSIWEIAVELSIACNVLTLKVFTQKDFPIQWADAQTTLAFAHTFRIRGDRVENLNQAINYYRAALEIFTVESIPQMWAKTQVLIGQLSLDQLGNYQVATEHLQAAYKELSGNYNDTKLLAQTMFELARCFHKTGALSQSKIYFKDSIRLYQRLEQPTQVAAVTSELGNLELQMGQIDDARIHLQTALDFYQTANDLDFPEGTRRDRIQSIQDLQKYLPVSSEKIAS
jgi:tetratricopeptide (TPR) repeat protein